MDTAWATYLDVVVLLGAILVKQATGSWSGHKQDGLEGYLTLSHKVDVSQRVVAVLLESETWFEVLNLHVEHKIYIADQTLLFRFPP